MLGEGQLSEDKREIVEDYGPKKTNKIFLI